MYEFNKDEVRFLIQALNNSQFIGIDQASSLVHIVKKLNEPLMGVVNKEEKLLKKEKKNK